MMARKNVLYAADDSLAEAIKRLEDEERKRIAGITHP